MKKIALIGAFDRFNYGDLLMPVVFNKQMEAKNEKAQIDYFAYQENDLKKFGAYKTKRIEELRKLDYDAAVFVGGDMLPVTYTNAFMDLQTNKIKVILYKLLKKFIKQKKFDLFCKKSLNGETNHPWIYSKKFLDVEKIIYNTVGGKVSVLDSQIEKCFNEIDYISLRDNESFNNFNDKKNMKKLYPDSVIALSEFFDNNDLTNLINEHTKKMKEEIGDDYFVLQTNKYIGNKYFNEIVKQIKEMYSRYNIKCLLLPIGYANNHEDDIVLRKIYKKLKSKVPVFMAQKGNIYDIVYNIKNSKFYVGTSLHGIITSASYGVPHFAYTNKINKAINFEKTWNTTPIIYCEPDELSDKYNELISNVELNKLLEKNKKELINLANENFNNIFKVIFDGEDNE